ncbi:MAG: NAD(P)-binding domain-containing protein [Rhodospirillaceae bacterium]|jgi:pyrroline-5-carboxylate reductase|nr:NAD(P)-binding domain-containing protein [Rhodospirillales bacterium]MBT6406618.1 NAD(P)-binding domain-containing protein [Rhodospirillaceae bacterium]
MKIGVIGTGNIATAVIRGLCTAQDAPERILLSPRNAQKSAALAEAFAQAEVAPDNQSVIDESDWMILAVRPQVAHEVLSELNFRSEQKIVSLIAAVTLDELRDLCEPATDITRAVPLPPVAQHIGPTAICPVDSDVAALFDKIGTAVPVEDEHQFNAMCSATATVAAYYGFLGTISDWMVSEGLERKATDRYLAALSRAVAADASEAVEHGFDALITDVATPGGMNEQVHRTFREKGWFDPIHPALDAILARYEHEK